MTYLLGGYTSSVLQWLSLSAAWIMFVGFTLMVVGAIVLVSRTAIYRRSKETLIHIRPAGVEAIGVVLLIIGLAIAAPGADALSQPLTVYAGGGGPSLQHCSDSQNIPCYTAGNSGLCNTSGTNCLQNACDGVLRPYGRCEQGSFTQNIPACCLANPETFTTITTFLTFPVPFTNTPTITYTYSLSDPHYGSALEVDIPLLATNGTISGGTCVGCSRYAFPAVGARTVLPSGNGWLTVGANDGFQYNNFPSEPTNVLLEMNVVSRSNVTANGRQLMLQGFDTAVDGVDCNTAMWENVTSTEANIFPINFGSGDIRGGLTGFSTIGGSATVNGTIFNDLFIARAAGCESDLQLRVLGALTSGHETITFSKLVVVWFYTFVVPVLVGSSANSISVTGVTVQVIGPYGGSVEIDWKAISESG